MLKSPCSVLSVLFILLILNCFVFSQSDESVKKTVDFGASLKPGFSRKVERYQGNNQNASQNDKDVIRIETDLIVNDVMVLDKKGNSINGLTKDDFIVKEDGGLQSIETYSRGDGGQVARSIVLIIDYSGSLLPYIKTSLAAAKTLVDKLKPQDRMAIVTDDVELLAEFTHDKQLLKDQLDSLQARILSGKAGKSMQYSALYATLNELFDEEDVRPIIIFQTDGDQLLMLKGNILPPPPPANLSGPKFDWQLANFSFDELVTATEKTRTTIYTIIPGVRFFGLPENEQIEKGKSELGYRRQAMSEFAAAFGRPATLNQLEAISDRSALFHARMMARTQLPIASLAKFTGGWTDFLETPEQANDVYSRVLADINSRYLLGYYPTNQTHDGKRRSVTIEVRGHPEYIVWGRKTYFAPEP